jgi:hypothetical protein
MTDSRKAAGRIALAVIVAGLLASLVAVTLLLQTRPADAGLLVMRKDATVGMGTPVALPPELSDQPDQPQAEPLDAEPVAGDPLDGDPLDGDPDARPSRGDDPLDGDPPSGNERSQQAESSPRDFTEFAIVRSGRPNDAPKTVTAYDGDPETIWKPDADSAASWVWLDLGEEKRIRLVRVLTRGAGVVEVEVSSDRRRWQQVGQVAAGGSWQEVALRDDAQYVRLTLVPDDDDAIPAVAEVAVYGNDRGRRASLAQDADYAPRRRGRQAQQREQSEARQAQQSDSEPAIDENTGSDASGGRITVSAEEGETRCEGERNRCEARRGQVSVEEDCAEEGTCIIEVHADGGTAICDAAGGDSNEVVAREDRRGGDNRNRNRDSDGNRNRDGGRNRNREQTTGNERNRDRGSQRNRDASRERSAGDGGRCEAVANGGAVTIGDINP